MTSANITIPSVIMPSSAGSPAIPEWLLYSSVSPILNANESFTKGGYYCALVVFNTLIINHDGINVALILI